MADPILSLSNVDKHFGGVVVLKDVSFDVAQGARHALIGPNADHVLRNTDASVMIVRE